MPLKPKKDQKGTMVPFDFWNVLRSVCRESFWEFVKHFWECVPGAGVMVPNWHMELLCNEMQAVAERIFKGETAVHDVVLNLSPGTSKSTITGILFPPWTWTRMPTARHLTASHTEDLVLDIANKSRIVINSEKYKKCFPGIDLRKDQDTKGHFINTAGGDRYACTVGGKSPMGFHAHFLCLSWASQIITDRGNIPIGKIVEEKLPVKILSFNLDEKCFYWRGIEEYQKNPDRFLCSVYLEDGIRLQATKDHPVYVDGEGFVSVDCISPGDKVYHLIPIVFQGTCFLTVVKQRVINVKRDLDLFEPVYNLKLEGEHNYFADGVLVHNCGDDLIDPKRALSAVEAANAKEFIANYLPTRMVDKRVSTMFLVMQRLGKDDPTDVMIEISKRQGARPVRHICLPAEYTSDVSPINEVFLFHENGVVVEKTLKEKYQEGNGLMDPVRLSKEVLRNYEARGRYSYQGQFLQKPIPPGGQMFRPEYFNRRVKSAPYNARRIRFWDRGATSDGGCYTAGVLLALGKEDGTVYVEDVVHGQWEPRERNQKIVATALRDRSRYGPKYTPAIYIEAERGSTGFESFQNIASMLSGFVVREDKPTGSKNVRAEPWSSCLAAGNVALVENGSWDINGFVDELVRFTPVHGKRYGGICDQVDASSACFSLLVNARQVQGVRVLGLSYHSKNAPPRIVVCSKEDLPTLASEQPTLILHLTGVLARTDVSVVEDLTDEQIETSYEFSQILDHMTLEFADIDPKDYQDTWLEPIIPWGKSVEQLMLTRDQSKKLWGWLLKKREIPWRILVIEDNEVGHRCGLSVGYGIADALHIPRSQSVFFPADSDKDVNEDPPNSYVFDLVKTTRNSVV